MHFMWQNSSFYPGINDNIRKFFILLKEKAQYQRLRLNLSINNSQKLWALIAESAHFEQLLFPIIPYITLGNIFYVAVLKF